MTSVASCTTEQDIIMQQKYGSIFYSSVNVSHNTCMKYSALYCSPSIYEERPLSIEFSAIVNNTAHEVCCIYLEGRDQAAYSINFTNLLSNFQEEVEIPHVKGILAVNLGMFYSEQQTTLYHCNILNNTADTLFHASNNDTFIFVECHISNEQLESIPVSDWINIDNLGSNVTPVMNPLSFLITGNCESSYKYVQLTNENSILQENMKIKLLLPLFLSEI